MNDNIEKPAKSRGIDRKTFLRTAGSVALFAALGIQMKSCDVADSNGDDDIQGITIDGNTITLNLASDDLSVLNNQNGWMHIAQAGILVVNVDGDLLRAFSDACPHAGCRDSWNFANQRFVCTCHNSIFEKNGSRVSGPATRDLTEWPVQKDGNIVTIIKVTGSR